MNTEIKKLLNGKIEEEVLKDIIKNVDINTKSSIFYNGNLTFTGLDEEEWLDLLIKNGLNIHYLNNEKQNALFFTNEESSSLLIKKGIDVNVRSISGKNALCYCYNNEEKYNLLINSGLDIHNKDNLGENILFNNNLPNNIIKRLIELNVSLDSKNYLGETFIFSSNISKLDFIKELGIKLNYETKNNEGFNVLEKYIINRDYHYIKYIYKEIEDKDVLYTLLKDTNIFNDSKNINLYLQGFLDAMYLFFPSSDLLKKRDNEKTNLDLFINLLENESVKDFIDLSKIKNSLFNSLNILKDKVLINNEIIHDLKNIILITEEKHIIEQTIYNKKNIQKNKNNKRL